MTGRQLPERAWDCHAHVIGPREGYPLATGHDYDPAEATLEAYLALLDRHGLARGVLVQPSVYGFDNRCLLDALDRAEGRLVGVAVPPPDAIPGDLEAMHRRGVRGVRLNLLNSGGLGPEDVLRWRPTLRELGWHVGLHVDLGRPAAGPEATDPGGPAAGPETTDLPGRAPRPQTTGSAAPAKGPHPPAGAWSAPVEPSFDLALLVERLQVPVVVDHMGR
ncbi:MAG TPA: amidohydrolase family protein, partial [Longimicrobiales bacterium]|nr:amidohydrolase family protein [Longimicrobiales bacterium]